MSLIQHSEDYNVSCLKCGESSKDLMMIAHRHDTGKLVGWIFSCKECAKGLHGATFYLYKDDPINIEKIRRAFFEGYETGKKEGMDEQASFEWGCPQKAQDKEKAWLDSDSWEEVRTLLADRLMEV